MKKDIQSVKDEIAAMTTTKLKRKLYSMINYRNKLVKKGTVLFQYGIDPSGAPEINDGLELINESIRLLSDEVADRKLANILSRTESTDDGKRE